LFKTLLVHEILSLIKSRRVYYTVAMFILLFASIFIVRVIDYQKQINQYITDVKDSEETLQNALNYSHINPLAIQQPKVFSIYNQGIRFPRVISIRFYQPIISSTSLNEETNLVYNEETQLDITFLITFFLSLFILLISYDSVNGEKQVGTLRILMTYPLKRQSFILKKILGVFIFVAITFTIPYVLSLFTLIIIYADLLSASFFMSVFFYWFLVLLFILFFSLLGIFISVCSTSPNRSLVWGLLVWTLFCIILPTSWEYIFSPLLYNNTLSTLTHNYEDKITQSRRIFYLQDVDETKYDVDKLNLDNTGHFRYNGGFWGGAYWSYEETYEQHYRFAQYVIDEYYPAARLAEQAVDELYRKQISIDNVTSWIFFFNPIVLFENLSRIISGNSREDYLLFLHSAREIRDELTTLGLNEGWLQDFRFFAMYKEEYNVGYLSALYERFDNDEGQIMAYLQGIDDITEPYEMTLPYIRPYAQPVYTFGEIFKMIWQYLVLFVVSVLVLWLMTWQQFMKYDVR